MLAGCAAVADPLEDESMFRHAPSSSSKEVGAARVVVLPVFNATGRRLRISTEDQLGLFGATLSRQERPWLTVPELLQAGFILGLHSGGLTPATMAWTNDLVSVSPETLESAWNTATDKRLTGEVVWMALTEWDDSEWRQRGAVLITAEVARFQSDDPTSLRIQSFRKHRMVIPAFSSPAQAAGHVGMRLAQLTRTS